MSPETFLHSILDQGLILVQRVRGPLPFKPARGFLLTVALQENGPDLEARYQGSPAPEPGPARGWWQFEEGGGVHGVLTHPASERHAHNICSVLSVVPEDAAVWRCLEGNGLLAAAFARLLLFTDPHPVPTDPEEGWACYNDRLWRPGKPHPETWEDNWELAHRVVEDTPLSASI